MAALTVAQIAELCQAKTEGPETRVLKGANTLEAATSSDLAFAENPKAWIAAERSSAGCLIVSEGFDKQGNWSLIRVPNPRTAFVQALRALYPQNRPAANVHHTAVISASAKIEAGCAIGPYVTIGDDTLVRANTVIAPGCHVGRGVEIGQDSVLHAGVTIYDEVRIGARAIVHAGCVIGADGFGYVFAGDHYEKFPQAGTVEIGDDVEIGANSCIDRAALGATRIGNGTKLDNLVHVAHNCVIGEHVVVAAQAGFSGSVTVGNYAVIGGQAGIGEKARIDAKSIVGGKSGILTGQHVQAGEPVWGIPARPLKQHLKGLASVNRLPEMRRQLQEIKEKISERDSDSSAHAR